MHWDTTRISVLNEMFSSIAEEMGAVLERVSHSPNIRERRDYSCAIFDANGRLLAQAAHIPVHLGAMEHLMLAWLADGPAIEAGKHYITNDPYFAGTHLPDISVISRVTVGSTPIGFVVSRAHHSDVGGVAPGSFAPASSVQAEGIIIRPQELTDAVIAEIAQASRNPSERHGDLTAQLAAGVIGMQRMADLWERLDNGFSDACDQVTSYSESLACAAIARIPDGVYAAEDRIEGIPGGWIRCKVTVAGNSIEFDFTGSSAQAEIGVNATEAVTRSACYYILKCLQPDSPTNAGTFRPASFVIPVGTIVAAAYPAPVVAGNTETSQRIVDAVIQALASASVDLMPACSQGTMNSITFGSDDWAYYETIAGGAGATSATDGADAIHTHMTNTRNTPIEALELSIPIRVRAVSLEADSGGKGIRNGGCGIRKTFEVLAPRTTFSIIADRQVNPPPGSAGGSAGSVGMCIVERSGRATKLGSKTTVELDVADVVTIVTPGGGGWGHKTPISG